MKTTMKRLLSLCLVMAVLLSAAAILPASAKGEEELPEHSAAVSDEYCDAVAADGVITPKYGALQDGKAKTGDVLTVSLDERARPDSTFMYWKSANGDIVEDKSFEVYVDRDIYFYPVYSDLTPAFGEWTLLKLNNCEVGDIYVRTDAALGYSQYKVKYHPEGHQTEWVCVDEDTCREICVRCGWHEDREHDLSYNVIKEATAAAPGLAEYICVNGCGYSYTEELEPLGEIEHEHSWTDYGAEILTEAKDGQPGVRRVHCRECTAAKDVWYIKAEWEKYYFGSHVFFDVHDSTGLWGTDDEHHYSFVNNEGYNTYVYAVRKDYRDSDQCWVFMWIDHADALGRKPLYLSKSKGQGESYIYDPYSWAIVDYGIDTVDQYIRAIDHISCGDDSYSSSFFDVVKRYETMYNEQYFPADGSSDFMENMNGEWVYESEGTKVDDSTGIEYVDIRYNDSREFLHIDPLTNCVIMRYEPNASYRWSEIKAIQPITVPDEYAAILAAFPPVAVTPAPDPNPGEVIDGHGDSHHYGNYYQQTKVNEQYHKLVCEDCGYELYSAHEMSLKTPHLNFSDPHASTATYYCPLCGYEEEKPYLMSTADIADNIYKYFSDKSTLGIGIRPNVTETPTPVNFQLRVDTSYLVGGPEDNTYESGYADRSRYYSSGYAAATAYSYDGSQSDYLAFGVIRAGSGYQGWAGVTLKLPEVANYAFIRWEIYDWTSGAWQLFSTAETPHFNDLINDVDTRVHDLTLLRAVREYIEPERYTVRTIGATFEISGSWGVYYTERAVDANTSIYLTIDESAIPEGMAFDTYEVYDGDELIGTTDGWNYCVARDGLVFRAAYKAATYPLNVSAEHGYVYLVGGGEGGGKDKDKGKEEGDAPEEFWGGEYPAGTQLILTTVSEDETAYPYFLGWYYVVYSETGEERELLTTDRELTVTVKPVDDKEGYGAYVAIWSDSEEIRQDTEYRVLRVIDGFARVRKMYAGLYLSSMRVPYYSAVSFKADPGMFIDVEKWTITGTYDDESAYSAEHDPADYEWWTEGEDFAPAEITAEPLGSSNLIFADSDGDGKVTVLDATRIQRVLAAYDDDLYGRIDLTCDISGNDDIDILDATLIQRWLASYDVTNGERFGTPIEPVG